MLVPNSENLAEKQLFTDEFVFLLAYYSHMDTHSLSISHHW